MNPVGLDSLELENIGQVFYNLSFDELIEHELKNGECKMTSSGATTVDTGIFTGRSPKDKYFVDQAESNKYIAWGDVNQPISNEIFQELLKVAKTQLSNKDIYVTDVYCGASAASKRSVRFVSEIAWQSHFVKNMFIRPPEKDLADFKPEFTSMHARQ
jgi:phosphoenolpyruvate carboxykinase (ATP)